MGSKTQQSTSSTAPDPAVQAHLDSLLNRGEAVANLPLKQYSGDMLAGFTPMQQQAMGNIRQSQGMALPFLNSAADMATGNAGNNLYRQAHNIADPNAQADTFARAQNLANPNSQNQAFNRAENLADPMHFNQQAVDKYYSPYQSDVINSAMRDINRTNQLQQNDLRGNAISAGAFGGDRAGVAAAELARNQNQTNNATLAGLENQGYAQALGQFNQQQGNRFTAANTVGNLAQQQQGNRFNASNLVGNLAQQQMGNNLGAAGLFANMGTQAQGNQLNAANALAGYGLQGQNAALQGAQAELGAGGMQQQLAQAQLNIPYQQFLQRQQYPQQSTNFLSGLISGVGPLAGGTTTQTSPGPNMWSQLLGLGTAAAGAFINRGGRVDGYADGGMIDDWHPDVPDPSQAFASFPVLQQQNRAPMSLPFPSIPPPAPQQDMLGAGEQSMMASLARHRADAGDEKGKMMPSGDGGASFAVDFAPKATPQPFAGQNDLFSRLLSQIGMALGGSPSIQFAHGGAPVPQFDVEQFQKMPKVRTAANMPEDTYGLGNWFNPLPQIPVKAAPHPYVTHLPQSVLDAIALPTDPFHSDGGGGGWWGNLGDHANLFADGGAPAQLPMPTMPMPSPAMPPTMAPQMLPVAGTQAPQPTLPPSTGGLPVSVRPTGIPPMMMPPAPLTPQPFLPPRQELRDARQAARQGVPGGMAQTPMPGLPQMGSVFPQPGGGMQAMMGGNRRFAEGGETGALHPPAQNVKSLGPNSSAVADATARRRGLFGTDIGSDPSDPRLALMMAGLRMAASQSPFPLTAIAEGGMGGLQYYQGQQQAAATAAARQEALNKPRIVATADGIYAVYPNERGPDGKPLSVRMGDSPSQATTALGRDRLTFDQANAAADRAARAQLAEPGQVLGRDRLTFDESNAAANRAAVRLSGADKMRADAAAHAAKDLAALIKDGAAPTDPDAYLRQQTALYESLISPEPPGDYGNAPNWLKAARRVIGENLGEGRVGVPTAPPVPTRHSPQEVPGILSEARQAIARGHRKDLVIQRLVEEGIDPTGL